jgi:hypothetical protein
MSIPLLALAARSATPALYSESSSLDNAAGAQFVNRNCGASCCLFCVMGASAERRPVAALAVLVYDILLTTDEEVQFIWPCVPCPDHEPRRTLLTPSFSGSDCRTPSCCTFSSATFLYSSSCESLYLRHASAAVLSPPIAAPSSSSAPSSRHSSTLRRTTATSGRYGRASVRSSSPPRSTSSSSSAVRAPRRRLCAR